MLSLSSRTIKLAVIFAAALIAAGCGASANSSPFFGKTDPPKANILRYVAGSEPESLDPQISDGQPEARVYMALYEGLAEYDPKTTAPIPALAERWEINKDFSELTFHLRHDGRFSNGDPITARDFVYTIRRGMSPELASRDAALAYYIKNAKAYNERDVFVRDAATGKFLLHQDIVAEAGKAGPPPLTSQVVSITDEYPPLAGDKTAASDTEFHRTMHAPARLVLPADEAARNKALAADAKLKAAVAGKQFVPVKAEDIGVEAVDEYTLRIILEQPAPFF